MQMESINDRKYWSSLDNTAAVAEVLRFKYYEKNNGKFDENKDWNFTGNSYIWISSEYSAVHAFEGLLAWAYW